MDGDDPRCVELQGVFRWVGEVDGDHVGIQVAKVQSNGKWNIDQDATKQHLSLLEHVL